MFQVIRQLVKFAAVGAICAGVDLSTYFILTRAVPVLREYFIVTSVGTALLATGLGYVLNRRWTFRHPERSWRPYWRYLVVYGLSIVWQNMLLGLGVHWLQLYDVVAKVVAIGVIAVGWNFLLVKFWVFRYT